MKEKSFIAMENSWTLIFIAGVFAAWIAYAFTAPFSNNAFGHLFAAIICISLLIYLIRGILVRYTISSSGIKIAGVIFQEEKFIPFSGLNSVRAYAELYDPKRKRLLLSHRKRDKTAPPQKRLFYLEFDYGQEKETKWFDAAVSKGAYYQILDSIYSYFGDKLQMEWDSFWPDEIQEIAQNAHKPGNSQLTT